MAIDDIHCYLIVPVYHVGNYYFFSEIVYLSFENHENDTVGAFETGRFDFKTLLYVL